jgi:hypothetical protein
MTSYRITTPQGDLGIYEADSPGHALDLMAQDAGYRDQVHAAEVAGALEGRVEEDEPPLAEDAEGAE